MKKIISSLVFALAASILAIAPASAAPTITVAGGVSTGNTAATAFTATVPADNKVDAADAVRFAFSGLDTGTVVSAVATNAFIVPKLHAADAAVNAFSGVANYSVNTGTGTTAEFFVYSRSTSVGTVVVSNGGSSWTYYVKGTSATAHTFAVTLPTSAATSSKVTASVVVADVFANPVAVAPTVSVFNATAGLVVADANATGRYTVEITYPSAIGRSAVGFTVAGVDANGVAETKTQSVFVDVSDLAADNAKLKSDLAAAQKALADEKALHEATKIASAKALADLKAVSDKAVADLTATIGTLNKSINSIKAAYNRMAKKYKFAPVK